MNPSLPLEHIYTPYYCEENVYLLAETFTKDRSFSDEWEAFVLFLSNHNKTVALWNQKLSRDSDYPVVWDYHCVLLLKTRGDHPTTSWVFDYDSRLAMPCPLQEYIEATLGSCSFQSQLDDQFQSLFRVVPAIDYLECFASDRSHMLMIQDDGAQTFIQPPPSYPCIVGKRVKERSITNNLMDAFVSMSLSHTTSPPATNIDTECIGKVMTLRQFCEWVSIEQVI